MCFLPYMINKLVFCFESFQLSIALPPVTSVVGLLGSANVLDCQMRHYIVHRVERLVARLARFGLCGVNPETRVLLLDGAAHVAEERGGAWVVVVPRQRHVVERTC